MDVDELLGGAIGGAVLELLKQRLVRYVAVPAPGAGLDWAITVPASTTWNVLAVRGRLITSAVVATRIPEVRYQDPDGNIVARIPPETTQAASATTDRSFYAGLGDHYNSGGVALDGLPSDLPLGPGFTVRSSTFNLDVGDAWSLVIVAVREWEPSLVQRNLDWILDTLR